MNDEIKEILEEIDNKIIPNEHWNKIKNYITNLQEENEDLKDRLKVMEHFKNSLLEENEDYKSRCEEAIEFIMTELITEWDIKNDGYVSGSDLPVDAITPILNILGGDDDE